MNAPRKRVASRMRAIVPALVLVAFAAAGLALTVRRVGTAPRSQMVAADTEGPASCDELARRLEEAERRVRALSAMVGESLRRTSAPSAPDPAPATAGTEREPAPAEASIAELERAVTSEGDDTGWSSPMAAQLEGMARDTGPVLGFASAKCGRVSCLVELGPAPSDVPPEQGRRAVEKFVEHAAELLPSSLRRDEPGGPTTIVFARPGTELAAAAGGGFASE
jgi:hypothetical protein